MSQVSQVVPQSCLTSLVQQKPWLLSTLQTPANDKISLLGLQVFEGGVTGLGLVSSRFLGSVLGETVPPPDPVGPYLRTLQPLFHLPHEQQTEESRQHPPL